METDRHTQQTDTQMQETVPDPQVQRTVAMIMSDYVEPYRDNGEPVGVEEAGKQSSRAARRAGRARSASGLTQPPRQRDDAGSGPAGGA